MRKSEESSNKYKAFFVASGVFFVYRLLWRLVYENKRNMHDEEIRFNPT